MLMALAWTSMQNPMQQHWRLAYQKANTVAQSSVPKTFHLHGYTTTTTRSRESGVQPCTAYEYVDSGAKAQGGQPTTQEITTGRLNKFITIRWRGETDPHFLLALVVL